MPKASPLQPSFAAGEFSPRLYGRTDIEQYKTGLAECTNYMPLVEGPIVRRPGTKYVGNDVKNPAVPPVLIPFEVSETDAYVLEFGDGYIRFYKNGGRVVVVGSTFLGQGIWYDPAFTNQTATATVFQNDIYTYSIRQSTQQRIGEAALTATLATPGDPLELTSPFNSSNLSSLKWNGSFDTMYVTAGGARPIYKLQRFGEYDWTIRPVLLQDGPYLPFNTKTTPGDSTAVTLTPTGGDFKGTTFVRTGPSAAVTNITNNAWAANSSYALINLTVVNNPGFVVGQKITVDNLDGSFGTTFSPGAYHVDATTGSTVIVVRYPNLINGLFSGSAFVQPALFDISGTQPYADSERILGLTIGGKRYWGLVYGGGGGGYGQSASFFPATALPNTSTVSAWQLGVFRRGEWPVSSCFHQDRLCFVGNPARPLEVVLSATGDYENFQTSNSSFVVADNNALQFTLRADKLNAAQWVTSDSNGLLIGGYSSEWKVSPSSQATTLTPTNINATETSYYGSADAPPVKAGNSTIYIQRSNRNVRELNYYFQVNTYRSNALTELSEHITAPGVTSLVNQKETISAIWGIKKDGGLISMSYNRDADTLRAGWAKHYLGGQSDSGGSAPQVLSAAVIAGSGATFDQLWLCTRRFINGTSVVNLEYMTEPFEESSKVEDAFFVDCGSTYDEPINITGVTTAGSSIVTAPSHGLVDGDLVQITKVNGMNTSVFDINGIEFNSNVLNYRTFRAGSTATNTFFLQDINNGSSYIDTRSYSAYVSGGEARKLVSTISGLTWLKNETVSVLADGKVHPNVIVNSAGVITLEFSAAKVQVGLPYFSDAKTLKLDAGAGDGTSIGKIRRPGRVAFTLYQVGDLSVGPAFDKLTPLADVEQFKADQTLADQAAPLFSGIARESVEHEYGFDGQICFRQQTPLPGMIQSITQIIEENDV